MPDAGVSPRQRQTANGRAKFLERFPDDESRREHFRDLAQRSAAGRLTLPVEDVHALAECYRLLNRIHSRHPKLATIADPTDGQVA